MPLIDELESVLEGLALGDDLLRLGVEVSHHQVLQGWDARLLHVRL